MTAIAHFKQRWRQQGKTAGVKTMLKKVYFNLSLTFDQLR